MTSSKMKVRDSSLDFVCGILIIYMILYHAYLWFPTTRDGFSETLDKLFFFFMPWFYFKSGMFHVKKGTIETALLNVKKLLYPFLIYTFIGEIFYWMTIIIRVNSNFNLIEQLIATIKCLIVQGSTIGNQPLWFLLSLYLTKVTVTYFENHRTPMVTIIIISLFLAWISSNVGAYINGHFFIPYLIMSTSIGICFYGFGKLMRTIQYQKKLFIFSIIIYFYGIIFFPSQLDVRLGMLIHGNWFIFMISSLAGIIVINNVAKHKIIQFLPIIAIGKNSLSYYCLHWPLFTIITTIISFFVTDKYNLFVILCVLSGLLLPICTYWINIIKKKLSNYIIYL